jgi:fatty-acyl-CoA synthase
MTRMSDRVMNLACFLRQAARRYPDRTAIIWGDYCWTWAEVDQRVDAAASVLAAEGVRKGDRVLVQSRNSNQLIETMFACFRLGAVWVPTNFRQTAKEVAFVAQSSEARAMFCDSEFPDHASACGIKTTIIIGDTGEMGYEARLSKYKCSIVDDAAVEYDDPCWFFYTSGTTGRPKAAILTHGQMGFVIVNHLCDLMPGTTEEDASLVVAPLTHGAGVHLLTQVARAAKTVIPGGYRFEPDVIWSLIEHLRITNMFTVPTILKLLVEHPAAITTDHSALRHVIYAGAPMYRSDQILALKRLGPVLVQYFGLGEVTGAITVLPSRDHCSEDGPDVKIGTCGRERTSMQISVQDSGGRAVDAGEVGEICVCGPAVFAGYHNDPKANAAAFRDGWFRTGDLGYVDQEGDLFITGRASDMYISGGSNIYPIEIEEVILRHPAIAEAAVLGMPDPVWGEIGVAVCVRREGGNLAEAELLAWLRDQVAAYKIPRQVHFWDELPRSAYGKITKKSLRSLLTGHKN